MRVVDPGFVPLFLPAVVRHPYNRAKWLHLSEDWAFCWRAERVGVKSYLDMRPVVGHHGSTRYSVEESEPKGAAGEENAQHFGFMQCMR